MMDNALEYHNAAVRRAEEKEKDECTRSTPKWMLTDGSQFKFRLDIYARNRVHTTNMDIQLLRDAKIGSGHNLDTGSFLSYRGAGALGIKGQHAPQWTATTVGLISF